METKKKTRNSSLELLRIICMFLIIFHHYAVHSEIDYSKAGFTFYELYFNIIKMGGKLACDIFILITGYFMINSKFNINKMLKLIAKAMGCAGVLIVTAKLTGISDPSPFQIFQKLQPMFWGNWYLLTYFMLLVISPSLNTMLLKLNKREYVKLIMALLIVWSIVPTITGAWETGDLMTFVVMYIIGGYIQLFKKVDNNKKGTRKLMWISIASYIGLEVITTLITKVIDNPYTNDLPGRVYAINSLITVVVAYLVFEVFRNMKFESKTINWIASGTLGIYIIHDSGIVRGWLWNEFWPQSLYKFSKILYIHSIAKVLLVFIVAFAVERVIEYTLKYTVYKWIDKWKLPNKLLNKADKLVDVYAED